MPQEIRMPPLGQTTDELRIVSWLKAEGDHIALGEPLLEVDTDKATLQIESFVSGTLMKILCRAGEAVRVGSLIAYIGAAEEQLPVPLAKNDAPQAAEPTAPERAQIQQIVLASPAGRRLAKEHGIDLHRVQGSGPEGRIERRDVLELIEGGGSAETPVPRHRQVLAQRLTRSIQKIPHITLTRSVNMTRVRPGLNARRAEEPVELTFTHLLLRAIARALRQHPQINRLWLDEGPRFRQLTRADVGLAVAGDDNLLVVTIPEADRLSLTDLCKRTAEAVQRARDGVLSQADTAPTAITLSNLGMYGVDEFQAIIDPDQTAILATGQIADQVVVIDGGIHIVPQLKMNLTLDHRVVDGATAAQFLSTIGQELERGEV